VAYDQKIAFFVNILTGELSSGVPHDCSDLRIRVEDVSLDPKSGQRDWYNVSAVVSVGKSDWSLLRREIRLWSVMMCSDRKTPESHIATFQCFS